MGIKVFFPNDVKTAVAFYEETQKGAGSNVKGF